MTRLFTLVTVALAGATAIGLAVLWPGDVDSRLASGVAVESFAGTVEEVEETLCPGFQEQQRCQQVRVRLEEGPDEGRVVELALGAGGFDPDLDPGDKIRVTEAPEPPPGAEPVAGTGYSFSDFQRGTPMLILILAGLFVAVVLVFARWRGALSLAGLAASLVLVLVLVFVVPAILDGQPPLAVAVVGGEIVATLVGSIGLIAAVPVTTALAALLALSGPKQPARPAAQGSSGPGSVRAA